MPDAALASFSHTPFDVAGWASSQASHSALDAKASTGRPVLVFGNAYSIVTSSVCDVLHHRRTVAIHIDSCARNVGRCIRRQEAGRVGEFLCGTDAAHRNL